MTSSVVVRSAIRVGRPAVRGGADRVVDAGVADVRILQQAQLGLQAQDAQDELVEPGLRELAAVHGVQDRVPGHVDGRRVEELVDTGLERQDGDAVVAVLRPDTLHAERVGHHEPVVAEFLAQDAGEDRVGEGRGVPGRVEGRNHDVGGHDRVDAGADGGPEGHGVEGRPQLAAVCDDGEAEVAVDGGVPCPGKCFAVAATPTL